MAKTWDVFCIGNICYDYLGSVPEYPEWDQKIGLTELVVQGGGQAGTAAYAIACLGGRVSLAGLLGDDDGGSFNRRQLRAAGVNLDGVVTVPGARSQFAFVVTEEKTGHRTIFFDRGTLGALSAEQIDRDRIAASKALLADGRFFDVDAQLAERAQETGTRVVVDAESPGAHWDRILPHCDLFVPSQDCARRLTGEDCAQAAAESLLARGARGVVITLGPEGALALTPEEMIHQPAFSVEVVDTTGAGDVFHGALALGLARELPLRGNLRFAAAAAALSCRALGGRSACATAEEVQQVMEANCLESGA